MRRFVLPSMLALAVVLAACDRDARPAGGFTNVPSASEAPPVAPGSPEATASPTPPAVPASPPPTAGAPSPRCVEGWVTPEPGTPDHERPLRVIRRTTGVRGELAVVDMRMFVGPESPPSDKGYLAQVRRWYVKLYAPADPAFQGRFLVEARGFGRGVVAVAPYDSAGFRSPDWIGFQWEVGARPERYPGLPGRWSGTPYDFVRGGAGLTIPGLPREVVGCLEGT
ncbi:MAG: hypothetical protein KatS3mg013_2021 [Actinomycetota bacterium]|jgi:hypothetical protein|nr:MAG: hypothetical protein KatS3mg013_2021 [Actinomycetota bacterium]